MSIEKQTSRTNPKNYFIMLIIAIGIVTHINILKNDFVWDDKDQIVNNTVIHSFSNFGQFFKGGTFQVQGSDQLHGAFYRPIQTLAFGPVRGIYGSDHARFHDGQILVQLGSSNSVASTQEPDCGDRRASFFGWVFPVEPTRIEAVARINPHPDPR